MIRAIKAVSTERGRDPREFALFAFGGNGPLFACGMAAALGIGRVIVPPAPGLFSSFGLLYADVEHHYSRTFRRLLRQADLGEIERGLGRAGAAGRAPSSPPRASPATRARLRRSAALHYKGQSFELTVPVPDGPIDAAHGRASGGGLRRASTSGPTAIAPAPDEPVELVSIQVVGQGLREGAGVPERIVSSRAEPAPGPPRRAYFGGEHGWLETPVLRRSDLAQAPRRPAHRRGVRRHLRRAARRRRRARQRRQHRDRARCLMETDCNVRDADELQDRGRVSGAHAALGRALCASAQGASRPA